MGESKEIEARQMTSAMTDDEFWHECQSLEAEIEEAITIFYIYEELNRLGREDAAVFKAFNKDALFWNTTSYSLQTSLLILLARFFDSAPDSRSVYSLVNATLAHPERFSRDAQKSRRMKDKTQEPDWLQSFLNGMWIPQSAADLRFLKKAITPHSKKFKEVYLPIRHTHVAHRIRTANTAEMFQKTVRTEVGEILDFLRDLVHAVRELFSNGLKPELGTRTKSYERENQHIREQTKKVIMKFVVTKDEAPKQES